MTGTLHRAMLNRYALGTALALVIAPLMGIESAEAACTPVTAVGALVNNQNVSCSGPITDQNAGGVGWGTGNETGNTITISTGATVTGTNFGISVGHDNTIVVGASNGPASAGAISGGSIGIFAGENTTLHNSGAITGGIFGFNAQNQSAQGLTTVENSGSIKATAASSVGLVAVGGRLSVNSSGGISGGTFGIATDNAGIGNSGLIEATSANGVAIGDGSPASNPHTDVVTLDNSGKIEALNPGGIAIRGLTVNVNSNTGAISGDVFGIQATGTTTVKNGVGGVIQAGGANGVAIGDNTNSLTNTVTLDNAGTVEALGSGGRALLGRTVTVNSNAGDILANGTAIGAVNANVTNAKNIAGGIVGINAQIANVNNLADGTISGGLVGIFSTTLALNNAGTVSASNGPAVSVTVQATVNNSGRITGAFGIGAPSLTLTNSGFIGASTDEAVVGFNDANVVNLAGGTIQGTTQGIHAGTLNLVNAGMISGATAVKVDTGSAVITNFGSIQSTAGATGTAIQLSSAADTLNLKRGSSIVGMIDLGHGADVINLDAPAQPVAKGLSSLSLAASAVVDALKKQLENFDGVINLIGGGATASVQPSVTVNGKVAALDPTALAQQDRTLMDFTGGMSSMVQGRLGGPAGGSGPMAMSYAMEDSRAQIFNKALAPSWNAPVNVWSSGFGATRSQNGTDTTLDSTSSVFGGVIGIDRRIRPDWLIGAFAGGGSGTLNVDLGSQKLSTDYFSAGAYSRFEWASQFVDATLQVGGVNNRSSRLIQNNITGGVETATASYNGWFVSPEVAYGYRLNIGNGTVVTPMVRARYVAGFFDGYNETGSAQTLSIGSRTLQDFEERGEVEVAKTGFFGDPSLKGWIRGGVIALQRTGDTNVNAVLIGQNLSFLTSGTGSAVGGVGSVGFDYHVSPSVALFGSVEGNMMSDESRVVTAKGGVRAAF